MFRKLIPIFLVLALILSACSLQDGLPIATTAATTIDSINIPLPTDPTQTTNLKLSFGAGTLKLSPGAASLLDGTATYNVPDLKPEIITGGNFVHIAQGDYKFEVIPNLTSIKNEWDLQLGAAPLDLEVEAGAYDAEYALGGLPLVNLTIQDGASQVSLSFDQPNPTEMNLLRYETGASNVTITGLANANFASMEFSGGAGNYTLDFSGEWRRAASVNIETGVSNITLVIPQGIPVQLTLEKALANVTLASGWTQKDTVYTQSGTGPQLVIVIKIGVGDLVLTR